MLFTLSLLAATALAVPLEIKPKVHVLPLTHRNTVKNVKNLVESGKSRIQFFNGPSKFKSDVVASGTATNEDVSYVAGVTIGGKVYSLIVDTGSSNTWCGAQSRCEPSSTGRSTGGSVQVSYGSGSFSGTEYTDVVSYAGLTVQKQSIGAASTSTGFTGVDGIFGVGPVGLTQGTVSNANTVPTFLDNLYAQGTIPTEVLGVYFAPESGSDTNDNNGELTLGGTDPNKYSGSIVYVPKLSSGAAAPYWGVSVSAIKYGSTTLGSSTSGTIVDTGTTLIYIPTSAYNKFLSATGGRTDSNSGLSAFSTKPTQNFSFTISGQTFSLTPAQYLVPQAQYSVFGLSSGTYYSWINNGGTSGVNTIIGQKFLESYYSVYDTTNSRIGFAPRR